MATKYDATFAGFDKLNDFTFKSVSFKEFQSTKSGLKVFLMAYDTPIVNSYYVFPTQPDNNEGLPHTLEHLIFLGSELYPHRGTLDILACRALSIGTNAWTSVDHTAYTISTAGLEGTLKILPVYLDHMIRPALTQESFLTDVHHVTTDGSSSGVVYCEMKSSENSLDSLAYFETVAHLYPGESGYNKNYGGALAGIRSTNIERVREFHKKFYKWENLSIILCGNVFDAATILDAVSKAEAEIGGFHPDAFSTPIPRMQCWREGVHVVAPLANVQAKVVFPSEEEDVGNYFISWRGPQWDNTFLIESISFMGSYLVDSSTSPLEKELVQKLHVCSSVDFSMEVLGEIYYQIVVKNVPCSFPNELESIHEYLQSALANIYKSSLDMERMHILIKRDYHSYLREIELSPHEALIDEVVRYTTYGNNTKYFQMVIDRTEMINQLLAADEKYWLGILHDHFITPIHVVVLAVPSIERGKQLEKEENLLCEMQLEKYGTGNLKANKELVDRVTSQSANVPKDLFASFGFCDFSNIELTSWPLFRNFKGTLSSTNADVTVGNVQVFSSNNKNFRATLKSLDDFIAKLNEVVIPMQVNHIDSEFVRLHLLFGTRHLNLSFDEKRLLLLLCQVLFESNVVVDGKQTLADDFIMEWMDTTTDYGSSMGLTGGTMSLDSYSDLLSISVTCHLDKYDHMYHMLMQLLLNIQYNQDHVDSRIKCLLKAFKKSKRSGKCLVSQASDLLRLKHDSVRNASSLAQQQKFLADLQDSNVVAKLQELHAKVFTFENACIHLTANINQLGINWLDGWMFKFTVDKSKTLMDHLHFGFGIDEAFGTTNALVAYLPSTDVCYFSFITKAPMGYEHGDFCALNVLCEFLNTMESPLFRAIRGGGFSYNYKVVYYPSRGDVRLDIFQATGLLNAIKVTLGLVDDKSAKMMSLDDLTAAKASTVFKILGEEETLSEYSESTFMSALRGTSVDFNRRYLDEVCKLTLSDIKRVWNDHLRSFLTFQGAPKTLVAIAPKSAYESVAWGLKDIYKCDIKCMTGSELLDMLSNLDN